MSSVPSTLPALRPDDSPDDLKAVWPLVLRWGKSDDSERETLTSGASDEGAEAVGRRRRSYLPGGNGYLDVTGNAERAVPCGDLAQAAMEAQLELDNRNG